MKIIRRDNDSLPLIGWVMESALNSKAESVTVCTDSEEIAAVVRDLIGRIEDV